MIVISSGKMTIPEEERFIGFVGDNLHSQKQFILTDVSDEDCIYRLYLTFDDGTANYLVLDSKIENGSTILDWTVTQDDIYKSGVVNAQIKAFLADGEVYHTSSDYFYVEDSAEFATEFTEKENAEFLRYEAELNSILSEIKSSSYDLVPVTRTIAGVDLGDDITVKQLQTALKAYPLLIGAVAPTKSTVGVKNQLYIYVTSNTATLYFCRLVDEDTDSGEITYNWQIIGGSNIDLSSYVKNTLTLAGLDLTSDRTAEDLQTALDVYPLISKSVVPSTSTVGSKGQMYICITYDGKKYRYRLYYCSYVLSSSTDTTYNWICIYDSDEISSEISDEQIATAIEEYIAQNSIEGADGKSAYEIAVDNDFEGTEEEWLESLKGADGKDGADGYTPVKGVDYFTDEDKAELVDDVLTEIENSSDIPDYWQSALDEGVQAIRRAMESAGQNKSAFFFYSDSHWSNETTYTSKMAPTLLKYLYSKTSINQTNFGGDIVSAESSDVDTMAYLWDWREQLRDLPNHHSVVGNHDDGNTTNNLFDKNYIYSYLFAPEESNDIVRGNGFYYYIDNNSEKTRYLYLDTMYEGITNTQLSFVKEALKGVKDGWHIVAITHAWFDNDYTVYPPVISGFSSDAEKLLSVFDNYNSRIGDYAECGGWVEFCVGGHYHLDYDATSSTGIPVILVEADTFHDRSGTMPQHGTTDEASVSAIVADYNTNTINIIRIGRGESREIEVTTTIVNYTNVIPLSIGTDGEIFNSGQGWADSSRIGSSGIYLGSGEYYVTGHIEIDPTINNTFYLKNITFDSAVTNNIIGFTYFDASFTRSTIWLNAQTVATAEYSPVFDGTNIIEFTLIPQTHIPSDAKYIAFCTEYIGTDSIITINEPIE